MRGEVGAEFGRPARGRRCNDPAVAADGRLGAVHARHRAARGRAARRSDPPHESDRNGVCAMPLPLKDVGIFIPLAHIGFDLSTKLGLVVAQLQNAIAVPMKVRQRIESVTVQDIPPLDIFALGFFTMELMFNAARYVTDMPLAHLVGAVTPSLHMRFVARSAQAMNSMIRKANHPKCHLVIGGAKSREI